MGLPLPKLHLEHLFGCTTFPHPHGPTKLVIPLWQGAGTSHNEIWWHEAAPWCYRCVGFDYSSVVCVFKDQKCCSGREASGLEGVSPERAVLSWAL